MPNKLTDTEIKKALECCSTYHDVRSCKNCPLDGKCEPNMLEQYALDLINRYEEENKKWQVGYMTQKQEIANLEIELQAMRNAANGFKAEVERLQKALENQQKISMDRHFEVKELKSAINGFRGYEDKIKAEAYKEAFDKVKEELKNIAKIDWKCGYYYLVGEAFFDNLLNELVGDKNGKDL